jgi:hypothetical protein
MLGYGEVDLQLVDALMRVDLSLFHNCRSFNLSSLLMLSIVSGHEEVRLAL